MSLWPVQNAKTRFSELLAASVEKGPQIATRRGIETAVLVCIEEWRRLLSIPPRGKLRRRAPVEFQQNPSKVEPSGMGAPHVRAVRRSIGRRDDRRHGPIHGLTVATRNTRGFDRLGVSAVDPFRPAPSHES
ncbi:MAG: type II toxin-antitoxin system prevent-host-death family antitoxin [Bryobacteraceae bacterium]|jgi:prevent-host-death family protein